MPRGGYSKPREDLEEALKNLKEATELYLEEFPLKINDKTFITTFEVAEFTEI